TTMALTELILYYKNKEDFDNYIYYFVQLLDYIVPPSNLILDEIQFILTQDNLILEKYLIANNFSIGLINLVKYHNDYKDILKEIKNKIILYEDKLCDICIENKNTHVILSCLNHF